MTTLKPAVSICCTTYNQESYIRDCLEGFIMQKTNFPFEVLIHDDASADGTADIIREYEAKYPEIIKPIYQTENQFSQGIKISFVYNFPRAQGKYIAFCEGDDYWTDPEKLQIQFDFMESHPDYSMCFHRVGIRNEATGETSLSEHDFDRNCSLKEVIAKGGGFIPTASVFFRSKWMDFLMEFCNGCPVGDFSNQVALAKAGEVYCFSRVMATYRRMAKGSWTSGWSKNKNRQKLLDFYQRMHNWLIIIKEKYDLPEDAMQAPLGEVIFHILWLNGQYDMIRKNKVCIKFLRSLNLRGQLSIILQLYGLRKRRYLEEFK